ncbi:hypothetical protein OJ252_1551 [Cryptosporidium canis]|uniref:leucine--tRNA ligase n=1 Tax=Cryptosporidium canis TaxID=195482 RepID=A0ABQ8P7T8_9CRYT|nr:hypothetical protein OJ252_1551 [Cryptosporidium canis]
MSSKGNDSGNTGGSRHRRDKLLSVQHQIQKIWEENQIYEADADLSREKYMITFPYPYMNGRLHLGHAFTLTKADFQARFQRMNNKNVLFPFGFHCTGMPICASADKLKAELSSPKSAEKEEGREETGQVQLKSKVAAKTGGAKTQSEILRAMGIPDEEIGNFTDPVYWTEYFPPLAKKDLKDFGTAIDWRRSFITTDINPYYDAFVKWQFRTLKFKRDKIRYGLRPAVFSRIENQPCADHDRSSGEGVGPQEYTLVMLKALNLPENLEELVGGRTVYFVCATLRPETMYGQTNCWILPTGEYELILAFDSPLCKTMETSDGVLRKIYERREDALADCNTVFICSKRSAYNMAYQGIVPLVAGNASSKGDNISSLPEIVSLSKISGENLIGIPLMPPNAYYSKIYSLPMFSISMDKGTGVVSSVPSDSPDDYAAWNDIKTKAGIREKYNIKEEWILDLVPIIDTPELGTFAGEAAYMKYKVQSQNDSAKLKQAKEEAYKKGFYDGIMIAGDFKGMKVSDVKDQAKQKLINDKNALIYLEPENTVISRTGESCIIALCKQWYLEYGEEKWRKDVYDWVSDETSFETFYPQVRTSFLEVINWLREWACSRSYGLGTYLPWDTENNQKVLIESLSDSTIYMAYYTICHFLHSDLEGKSKGLLDIPIEYVNDDLFDYVFCLTDEPSENLIKNIGMGQLEQMRKEFSYFYPLDCRVSGKDLIFNHLTMCLYNHAAIWENQRNFWPRSFYCNGHVMIDSMKMSKSSGNWITLEDGISEYSADACRIALADAGDMIDDANFCRDIANSAIMRLYSLIQSAQFYVENKEKLRGGSLEQSNSELQSFLSANPNALKAFNQADQIFTSEVIRLSNEAYQSYKNFAYRDALKYSLFEFQLRRDQYRLLCDSNDLFLNKNVLKLFIETQIKILTPIAPHTCEYIWRDILGNDGFIVNSRWPEFDDDSIKDFKFSPNHSKMLSLLIKSVEEFRKSMDKWSSSNKKGGSKSSACSATIYVSSEYQDWQIEGLNQVQKIINEEGGVLPKDYISRLRKTPVIEKMDKNMLKNVLSFISLKASEYKENDSAFSTSLPFDEFELFETQSYFISKSLGLKSVQVKHTKQDYQ